MYTKPNLIQTLQWNRQDFFPAVRSDATDPVRSIRFDFYEGRLFRIVAIYGTKQLEGMSSDDLVEEISKTYVPPTMPGGNVVVSSYADYERDLCAGGPLNLRNTDHHWYALQVRRRLERVAASHLTDKGYEGYLPMYKSRPLWPDQTKTLEAPLFTGYTFCRLNVRQRLSVLLVPGVLSIAGVGKVPTAIPDEEILSIQTVMASGLLCGPWSKPSEGQRVRVERGPLAGLEGTVVRVQSAFQLILALPLIQRSVFVRIDQESIEVRPELLVEVAPTQNRGDEPFHGHA